MALVNATIKNRITSVSDDVELVCNNPTDVIEIDFDEEWSGKTGFVARFEWNGKYFDVPFTGNKVQVPEISNTGWIMFGVYADNITAAPTKIKCKKSILCYGDGIRQVPANPFYDEFVERLENVEEALEHSGGGSGGISEESDPTVPAWAKQPEKPKYTADEVGAQPKGNYASHAEVERLSEEIGKLQYKTVTSYTLYASAVKDSENYWRIPAVSESQLQSGEKYKIVVTAANNFSVETLQVGTGAASSAMVDTIAQNISVKAGEQFEAEYVPTQDGLRFIRVVGAGDKISSLDFYLLETKTVSTIPELDATLTEFGKAADAKAVGDKFSVQAKQIARLNEEVFIVPAGVNMIDPNTSVAGYIGGSGGDIVGNAGYLTTDYIYIPAGRTISVTPKLRKFLAYEATNKEPIYASYVNDETANYVYTADAACYVRVSYWANNASSYKVEFVEDAPISLNIASFGDSIAFGDGNSGVGIADVVAQHTTATVWEYAKGGATIAWDAADAESESDTTKRQNIQYQVTKCIGEHTQAPDIILLDGGTNDNGHGITLGEISDGYDAALDNTTYCGGLETIIKTLKNAYPEAMLIFVLVHRMGSRDNAKQNSFADKAIEICNKWSVGLADVFHRSNLNTFLAAYQKYTNATTDAPNGDKTHPTQEGYEKFYLPIVMDEIKRLKLVD